MRLLLRRLLLVRHGETNWNLAGRFQGVADTPLNETGREQARALAGRLRRETVDALFTSPLVRAVETAEAVAAAVGRAPVVVPDFRERDVGLWGGLTYADVRERFPDEWQRTLAGEDVAIGGGETTAAVQRRMAAALDSAASRHPGGCLVVVSHGLALRTLTGALIGLDASQVDRLATGPNASVTVFETRRGLPRLVSYADASHLATVRPTDAP